MNVSTAGKKSQSIRITAAAVLLAGAGAGLSGCVADPYYNGPGYSQGYGQPAYSSGPYYGTPAGYSQPYDPYYSSPGYYPTYSDAYYPAIGVGVGIGFSGHRR